MKVNILTTAMFILSFSLFGQADNGYNNSIKIGVYPEFHPNGKLKLKTCYGTPHKREVTDVAVAFQLGLKKDMDTLIYYENLDYIDFYEYDENWNFIRIRREKKGENLIYLYGKNSKVRIYQHVRTIQGRVSEEREVGFPIVNVADENLTLAIIDSCDNITAPSTPIVLSKNDTTQILFKVLVGRWSKSCKIRLQYDSNYMDLQVFSFGYDVTSDDIPRSSTLKITGDSLIYFRTGNEALLEIYDAKRTTVLHTSPLSLQKNVVFLDKLKLGNYWLRSVDYSDQKEFWLKMELN